jgi:superfamily II DNA or RNA helicase
MYQLFDNQIKHVENIKNFLDKNKRALDTSETGTGKTYTSVYICKKYDYEPFIICPKILILNWINVLKQADIKKYSIASYEKFYNLKYYDENNVEQKFELITKIIKNDYNEISEKYTYQYNKDKDDGNNSKKLIIYDEIHKCKNSKTLNSKILLELNKINNINILLLSATLLDKHHYFTHIGYILGIYNSIENGKIWLLNISRKFGKSNISFGIFKTINNVYTSRMKLNDYLINHNFTNNIFTRCENMESYKLIEKEYENINSIIAELQISKKKGNFLSKIIYSRQQIELLKIPTFIKLTTDLINDGKSVVIFVNFTQTLLSLAEKLNTDCLCYGDLTEIRINKNINDFIKDNKRIIICNIKKSTIGISLHDINGNYPRVSLISPTWSAIELLQSFGRIFRIGVKSDVKQYILFCLNTYEEKIAENIKAKIKNIAMFNDGDCLSYIIEGFQYNEADCSVLKNNDFNFKKYKYEKKNINNKSIEILTNTYKIPVKQNNTNVVNIEENQINKIDIILDEIDTLVNLKKKKEKDLLNDKLDENTQTIIDLKKELYDITQLIDYKMNSLTQICIE